jgi:hypothetical protein
MIRTKINLKISVSAMGCTIIIPIHNETITFKNVLNSLNGYFASTVGGDYRITFNKLNVYGVNLPLTISVKDLSDEYKRIIHNLGLNHSFFKTDLPDIFGSDGYRVSVSVGDRKYLETSSSVKEYIDITKSILSEISADKEKMCQLLQLYIKKFILTLQLGRINKL